MELTEPEKSFFLTFLEAEKNTFLKKLPVFPFLAPVTKVYINKSPDLQHCIQHRLLLKTVSGFSPKPNCFPGIRDYFFGSTF